MDDKNNQANTNQTTSIPETIGSDVKEKTSKNIILIIILTLLLFATTATSIHFYLKYISAKQALEKFNTPEEITPSPTPTIMPTPTPSDNYFNNSSLKINYFPVQYNSYSGQQQKVAQTFTLDSPLTVQTVELKAGFGVGKNIYLNVYEAGNVKEFTSGNLVASGEYEATKIVKQETFEIVLNKPVQLEANKEYVLVISVKDATTQTSIAFSENNIFSNGNMYKFTRLIGGNGELLSNTHTWQPENSQDMLYYFKQL